MQITDSFVVHAPVEQVWQFLFDVERMSQCVPGVEKVERVDEMTYRGTARVRVGPLAAVFGGTVRLTEVEAPRRMTASVEGDDKTSATMVKATFTSTLNPVEGGTEVAYQMNVNLRGRLAQFGAAVVGATARKLTAEFAANLRSQLEH